MAKPTKSFIISSGCRYIGLFYRQGLLGGDFNYGLNLAGIGRFQGQSQVDLLLWDGKNLWIFPGGLYGASTWSALEMR